jgi:hypothetical protein
MSNAHSGNADDIENTITPSRAALLAQPGQRGERQQTAGGPQQMMMSVCHSKRQRSAPNISAGLKLQIVMVSPLAVTVPRHHQGRNVRDPRATVTRFMIAGNAFQHGTSSTILRAGEFETQQELKYCGPLPSRFRPVAK